MRADDISVANVVKGNPEKEMADGFFVCSSPGEEKRGKQTRNGERWTRKEKLSFLSRRWGC